MKPKSVYLVTFGEYSDYSVDAVFSERADAIAYCKQYNAVSHCGRDARIEVFLMDGQIGVTKRHAWKCIIDVGNGNLLAESEVEEESSPYLRGYAGEGYHVSATLAAEGVSFVSRDHARKLAAERRQRYLREELLDNDDEDEYDVEADDGSC